MGMMSAKFIAGWLLFEVGDMHESKSLSKNDPPLNKWG